MESPPTTSPLTSTSPFDIRSSRVCARCASIKQACDGASPCARCARLSLPCQPRLDGNELATAKPRVRRVHTGCMSCKKRKRKCDEVRPKCGDCVRLCLPCGWPAHVDKQTRPRRRTLTDRSSTGTSTSSPTDSQVAELDRVGLSTAVCQVPGSNDEYSPGLFTSAAESSLVITPDGEMQMFLESPLSSLPDLSEAEDRALLNHFVNITAPILSRRKDAQHNPYRDHLLPIAFANKAVMHSLLALSAGQWRAVQPSLANRGLVHQGKATKELARLLPQLNSATSEVAFATCLLLCMTELYDGSTGGWKHHLHGAKRLLQAPSGRQLTDSTSTFLRRLYRFLDSAATVSTCEPPLAQQKTLGVLDEQSVSFEDYVLKSEVGDDAAIYGIPRQLFHLLDQVNSLAHLRKTRVDDVSESTFRELAARTMAGIDHWSLEFGGLSPAVTKLTDGSNDAQCASAAFEWALRIRLHQIVEGYAANDAPVVEALSHIMSLVQQMRYGSALESCLLFPLVMAGGVSTTYEDCLVIHDRLSVMERTCGFGQVSNAKELVGRVWKERERTNGTNEIVNWARIRYYEMGGLAVF